MTGSLPAPYVRRVRQAGYHAIGSRYGLDCRFDLKVHKPALNGRLVSMSDQCVFLLRRQIIRPPEM